VRDAERAQCFEKYTLEERRRHDVRPGITGWAVVNGRNALQFRERLRLDVWYVDHWSLLLDLRILARTAIQVLRRTDVSTTEDLALGFPLPGVDVGTAGQPKAAEPPVDGATLDRLGALTSHAQALSPGAKE